MKPEAIYKFVCECGTTLSFNASSLGEAEDFVAYKGWVINRTGNAQLPYAKCGFCNPKTVIKEVEETL